MDKEKQDLLSLQYLLQNAANATSEGITISTMSEPDRPLIYVNQGFQRLTGYTQEEVLGRNCRFLQGEGTEPEPVKKLREAVKNEQPCTVELLNYKKDGTPFWNRLSITPIRNNQNKVTHYVGIQSDITQLKETKADLELANFNLQIFRSRILKELDQARMVQRFILPSELPKSDRVVFASLFAPMDEIGGDFFDVIELGKKKYGMLIADVTGHGIPAALLTFMSSTTFKNASLELESPADIISLTNERLFQKMPGDAFVTMFYCVYDEKSSILKYTQAGHPEAYIIRKENKQVIPLNTFNTFIGPFSKDEISFDEKEIQLFPGDKLVMYTDAITDTIEKYLDSQEIKDFMTFLSIHADLPLNQLFKKIYLYGLERGNIEKYPDDFSLLGMEVK